jgi:hypothetical protein
MSRMYNRAIVFLLFAPCMHAMDMTVITREIAKEGSFYELLPELRGRIIKDIFNLIIHEEAQDKAFINQNKLDECKLCIPVFLGLKCVREFSQLQNQCKQEIGGKTFAARELFVLPRKERGVFMRIANRGFLEYMCEGDLSDDDYKILETMENENIKKGLTLRLLQGNKITSYTRSVSAGCGCLSFLLLLCSVIVFNTEDTYLFYLARFVGRGGASLFGVFTLLEICGYPACIIKKQF